VVVKLTTHLHQVRRLIKSAAAGAMVSEYNLLRNMKILGTRFFTCLGTFYFVVRI
jgi:hypothetical protein